jgi:hypothetical protein
MLRAGDAFALVRARTMADMDCSDACRVLLAPARRLEAAIRDAVLDEGPDGIRAELTLAEDAAPFRLACHVADALTLALRAHAPLQRRAVVARGDERREPGFELRDHIVF